MNNIIKVFIGFILFLASFVLLSWNEGNNARNIATASYMMKNAVQIEPTNTNNTNSLIALTGAATTKDFLQDTNIKMPDTLVLERTVEMYQWEESDGTDSNGNTSYNYNKIWSEARIDSDSFHDKKYRNPKFPIESDSFYAQNVKLGEFDLTNYQIEKIVPEKEFTELPENKHYTVVNGEYFSGKDFQNPEIGDVLISYSYAPSGTNISFIGKQQANTVIPFEYKGRSNYVQYNGSLNKDSIIERYKHENKILTISLRVLGWLLMFIGLNLLISPLSALLGFIPLLGNIANTVSAFILMLVSLVLSLITISIAWFAYRPDFSFILISASLVLVMFIKKKLKKGI